MNGRIVTQHTGSHNQPALCRQDPPSFIGGTIPCNLAIGEVDLSRLIVDPPSAGASHIATHSAVPQDQPLTAIEDPTSFVTGGTVLHRHTGQVELSKVEDRSPSISRSVGQGQSSENDPFPGWDLKDPSGIITTEGYPWP